MFRWFKCWMKGHEWFAFDMTFHTVKPETWVGSMCDHCDKIKVLHKRRRAKI